MSLEEYSKKRKTGTPEPFPRTFVVHKHAASHLHYDLRLELDDVLKSWAVPKGPSLNPHDRRLALMVEDHPLDYQNFEGVIPEGNYGAGAVIVWDKGLYESKNIKEGLAQGKFSFILHGQKLNGEFTLTKIRSDKAPDSWLLLKKGDDFASGEDVKLKDQSVLSGTTVEEMRGSDQQNRLEQLKKDAPPFISPMLAKLADKPFDKTDWFFEIKWDGYRTIAEVSNNPRLYSRHNISFTEMFPSIARALKADRKIAVLDGEIVVTDKKGRSSIGLIQKYRKTGHGQPIYYVFDLLYLDGFDTRGLPFKDRRELLEILFSADTIPGNIQLSPGVQGHGKEFFEKIITVNDLEGMIGKNLNSIYKSGTRSDSWLKIKHHKTQEVVIGGYTEGRGGRSLGALLAGVYEDGQFRFAGHVGTGFDDKTEKELLGHLSKSETSTSPFKTEPKTNAPAHWVKPELVSEVRFGEWTADGLMRHPVFLGLRPDKSPDEALVEKPEEPPGLELLEQNPKDSKIKVGSESITISNYRKKFWPEEKITKLDLANYYQAVAPMLLPHLKDRPESLHRFPHGILDEGFYQKDTSELNLPDWIETIQIYSESNEAPVQYLICQNKSTLAYLANLGCIELNPWNSRVGSLDSPDYLVIDLDPMDDVPFTEVVRVARECKKIFDGFNVPSYCKTSGATGLHIYVPLNARYDYEQARIFSQLVANLLYQNTKEITTIERNPGKRGKKIYIDYLQNKKGQTLVAPYSLRPRPGAPVSTPLLWEEVTTKLNSLDFNIQTMPDRLRELGDLWQPLLTESIDLEKILERYEGR